MNAFRYLTKSLLAAFLLTSALYSYATDPLYPVTTASDAAKKGGDAPEGFFLRGDSRNPDTVFQEGFTPQGNDQSLRNHLSFAGNSAYIPLTRTTTTAQSYAFGRTGSGSTTGYVYLISATAFDPTFGALPFPNGHWVPAIFPNDPAVRQNNEFAVSGIVRPEFIAGAYEYMKQNGTLIKTRFIPNYQSTSSRDHIRPGYMGPSYGGITQYCRNIVTNFCNMFCGGDGDGGGSSGRGGNSLCLTPM